MDIYVLYLCVYVCMHESKRRGEENTYFDTFIYYILYVYIIRVYLYAYIRARPNQLDGYKILCYTHTHTHTFVSHISNGYPFYIQYIEMKKSYLYIHRCTFFWQTCNMRIHMWCDPKISNVYIIYRHTYIQMNESGGIGSDEIKVFPQKIPPLPHPPII